MLFLYSLKLFNCNIGKALKLFLYYIVIWGLSIALLLPVFFEFGEILSTAFVDANLSASFVGVFTSSPGVAMANLINTAFTVVSQVFLANLGLAIYALIVLFFILPMLLHVGDYTFCQMLHSYMSSKSKIGFFNALFKGLKRSVVYALIKTVFNWVFYFVVFGGLYGLACVKVSGFFNYALPVIALVLLVILYTFRQIMFLGFMPALIVFDCGIFTAYRKGIKAVKRHFAGTLATTSICFACFWLLTFVFGLYCLVVLIPLMAGLMSVYNMVAFFSSQGMRFYYNAEHILTPKKLEEVDNINKTAYIL